MRKTLTTCPCCGTGCMLYLVTDGEGRLVGVEPSGTHPAPRGALCEKGWNAFCFVHPRDRLAAPRIRTDGQLVPATWTEALDLVVARLREIQAAYGRDSVMFLSSGKATNEENYLMMKLARAVFRTNNVDHCARLRRSSTAAGLASAFGSEAMTNSISCFDTADVFLVLGSDTTEQHPLIGARMMKAVRRGARLILCDNRKIRLASAATLHLRPQNGTDVALLNGMMNVILREGLEDKEFILARTENYQALVATVEEYPPAVAADITGLTAEEIIAAARMYAQADKAMIVYADGIVRNAPGSDTVKSCVNLALLTGNIGRAGTGVNPLREQNNVQGACDMGAVPNVLSGYQKVVDPRVRAKFQEAWHAPELPDRPGLTSSAFPGAVLRGDVKACFILGEAPLPSDPSPHHLQQALSKLDFLAVQSTFSTAAAQCAHVLLPAASYAEKEGTFTSTDRRVQRVRKAVEPPAISRADWEILCDLARRAGYGHMNYASPGEVMDEIAALTPIYGGIAYGRIEQIGLQWPCPNRAHPGTPILHTETFSGGKGAFCPVSYRAPAERPDKESPVALSTGRCHVLRPTETLARRSRLPDPEAKIPEYQVCAATIRKAQ